MRMLELWECCRWRYHGYGEQNSELEVVMVLRLKMPRIQMNRRNPLYVPYTSVAKVSANAEC